MADGLARLEIYNKHHYRPNSYLHKWWARRCGTTFRLILKHLVDDPTQQDFYAAGGLAGKIILDPMMGGGTTLHEAIRLGAGVIGVDVDPLPVLQAQATLANVPLPVLGTAFKSFHEALRTELSPFYESSCPNCGRISEFWFMLYGVRRHCACRTVHMVDSLLLREEMDGTAVSLCPHCGAVLHSTDKHECSGVTAVSIVEKGQSCPNCVQPYTEDRSLPHYARYTPLVVAGHCGCTGRTRAPYFKQVDATDLARWEHVNAARETLSLARDDFNIKRGRKSIQLHHRNIENYLDLFSSRQLFYLQEAIHILSEYDPLIRLNLALLVSTSLEFNSMLCGYKGRSKRRAGAIRHTFAHHAYAFPHTALENNPIYQRPASGTLQKLFRSRIRNGRLWAKQPRERRLTIKKPLFADIPGEIDAGTEVQQIEHLNRPQRFLLQHGSATQLKLPDNSVDAVVTDPPYYDSVQYSDLSAYFRVWLQKLLPEQIDWGFDTANSAVDPHKNEKTSRYTELLSGIFLECRRVLKEDNGRFIFTFHHWNPKGWAALTIALKQAGFGLLNRYVVFSENPVSVHIANMKALTHDAILICAPLEMVAEMRERGGKEGWKRPLTINLQDSQQFCSDCATLLGWMLEQELPDPSIKQQWRQAL